MDATNYLTISNAHFKFHSTLRSKVVAWLKLQEKYREAVVDEVHVISQNNRDWNTRFLLAETNDHKAEFLELQLQGQINN